MRRPAAITFAAAPALAALALAALAAALAGCGDNAAPTALTPEQAVADAQDGQRVTVRGQVHAVTFDSTQAAARARQLRGHPNPVEWVLEQDDEEARAAAPAVTPDYADAGAKYPRTPDHYVLLRTEKPGGITLGEPGFNAGRLTQAWGLGVHLGDLAPGAALPEVGATVEVTGTFRRVTWNHRDVTVPILDDATLTIVDGPPPLAGLGEACALDQACNARLICDRGSHTCAPPPREIYWGDPWRDVNGACDTDDDCPLGEVCDASYAIAATGPYGAHYFAAQDAGRHLCVLAPGATVASTCPRIYTARDLVGGRFVTGKELCVRATLFVATHADDNDTHDQVAVDEPIPYPTADAPPNVFGATTENGPIYKDPARPGGGLADPAVGQEVIAVGTYRYDPDHGWYEVHPVKAYLTPP